MANVKLLRQQVTDYQRNFAQNRRKYEAGYTQYAADTNAFNKGAVYGVGKGVGKGYTYYDPTKGTNVNARAGYTPVAARTYDVAAPAAGTPHNTTVVPTTIATTGKNIGATVQDPANTRVWDAYDNVWRNSASPGRAPVQRQTKAPNLTMKEVGILSGKVNPYSYADTAKQQTSAGSAFADPEDPYNLKDAGILTRVIAGKI